MKIVTLYNKNRNIPWVSLSVVLCCIVITGIVIIQPEMYQSLAYSKYPKYIWQYCSGAFLHGTGESLSLTVMHLLTNILMFAPYAIMIEKLLGLKKFCIIFLCSWLGISAVYQVYVWTLVPNGEPAYSNGLSGISYAVIAIGACILFRLFIQDKRCFFRQPLAYLFVGGLLGELFVLMPNVAGVGSMIIHIMGIVIGLIMVIIFRASICSACE